MSMDRLRLVIILKTHPLLKRVIVLTLDNSYVDTNITGCNTDNGPAKRVVACVEPVKRLRM